MLVHALACVFLVLVVYILIAGFIFPSPPNDKPPGPRPLPLLGNLFNMPLRHEWKTLHVWAKEYGDIVYVEVLGRQMVILNTLQTANDLLTARASIYSDRPRVPLLELLGHGTVNFPFMSYGNEWRNRRKIFSSQFNNAIMRTYSDSYRFAVLTMLRGFKKEPSTYSKHLRLMTTQLMMDVTYGISVHSLDNHIAKAVKNVLNTVTFGLSPVMLVINPLDWIALLPDWVRKIATPSIITRWTQNLEDLRNIPFEQTKAEVASAVHRRSFVSELLRKLQCSDTEKAGNLNETFIRDAGLASIGGGSDTIISTFVTFLLAMILNPEIQQLAQDQINTVVGSKRLPDFLDREDLPLVSAIMNEALRWHPPAPFGVPHALKTDDIYRGYSLPAGTMVIPNICYYLKVRWSLARFLEPTEGAKRTDAVMRAVFGFGKRACPGIILAEEILWLAISQFLAVYTISLDVDHPPEVEFTSGAISQALPFRYKLKLRSANAGQLI